MTSIAYRDSALTSYSTAGATKSITIPGTIVVGDLMLLAFAAGSGGGGTTPAGWTALPSSAVTNGSLLTNVWYRVAQSGDAGSTVTVAQTTGTRAIIGVVAYSGVDTSAPLGTPTVFSETVSGNSHTAGSVTLSVPTWIVRFAFTKDGASGASTAFTPPAGFTVRQQQPGNVFSGTFQNGMAFADSAADLSAGAQAGTWSTDSATANFVAIGVALLPTTSTVTVRPVADITTTGTTLVGGSSAWSVLADNDPATYVEVPAGTFTVETKLGPITAAPAQVTVKYYAAGSPTSMSVQTSLYQGTTLIANLGTESTVVTTETTKTYSLTSGQQAAITNLSDLRVRQVVTVN